MDRKIKKKSYSIEYNKSKLKSGYLLLEFMIYIITSIILGGMLFILYFNIFNTVYKTNNYINKFIKLMISSDRLSQDIFSNNFYMNKSCNNYLEIKNEKGNIKWFLNKNRLIRQQYLKKNIRPSMSIVCDDVKNIYYSFILKENSLKGISYTICMDNNLSIQSYIAFRR